MPASVVVSQPPNGMDVQILSPADRATKLIGTIATTRKARLAMIARRRAEIRALTQLVNVSNIAIVAASVWAVAGHHNVTFDVGIVVCSVTALLGGGYLGWAAPDRHVEAVYEKCKKMAVLMTEIEQQLHEQKCDGQSVLAFDSRYQDLVGEYSENHDRGDYEAPSTWSFGRIVMVVLTVVVILLFPALWRLGDSSAMGGAAAAQPKP